MVKASLLVPRGVKHCCFEPGREAQGLGGELDTALGCPGQFQHPLSSSRAARGGGVCVRLPALLRVLNKTRITAQVGTCPGAG